MHMPCVLYGHFDKVACCEPNNNLVALLWDLEIAAKPCYGAKGRKRVPRWLVGPVNS